MRATIVDGTVSSIVIYLDKPVAPAELANQLELDEVRLVEVRDEKGELLGQAFPERGVMFGFTAGSESPRASQVLLEPLEAEPFLMRAEHTLRTDCAASIADTKLALRIEPTNPRAFWLQAEAMACREASSRHLKAAQEAVSIDADEQYRLTLAKLLAAAADYSQAMQLNQQLVEAEASTPVARGQAACQLADCFQAGPSHDYQQAVKYYLQAIKLTESLGESSTVADQRAAKRVLFDAHLGLAHAVGHGSWQQKESAVAKWLVRAKALAEELCPDQTDEEARRMFNHRSLAAWSGSSDPPDPSAWVDASVRLGKQAIDGARDPALKSRLQWELGVALAHAVLIEQQREKKNTGLEYGNMAASYLELGKVAGDQVPGHEYIFGRLYYQIGAIHAVGRKEHKQAVVWYQKAIPLLESPVPPGLARPHQQGEAFIGMAVSFWEVANRKEGMRLTQQGTKLMEQAVDEGLIGRSALAVPYGNLSSMHAQLGQQDQARKFAEMAASCDDAGARQR